MRKGIVFCTDVEERIERSTRRIIAENHIGIPKAPRTRDTCDFDLEKVNTRSARWRGMSLLYIDERFHARRYVYFSVQHIVVAIPLTI